MGSMDRSEFIVSYRQIGRIRILRHAVKEVASYVGVEVVHANDKDQEGGVLCRMVRTGEFTRVMGRSFEG